MKILIARTLVIGNGFIGNIVAKEFNAKIHKGRINTIYDAAIATRGYDLVINCAGYADVDGCENNFLKAFHENVSLPLFLRYIGKRVFHISTGCFKDGFLKAECIKNTNKPSSIYAKTKGYAEELISDRCCVIRIRLPYSENNNPKELFTKMQNMKALHEVKNSYTSIEGFLDDLKFLIVKKKIGIFHSVHDDSTPEEIGKLLKHSFKKIKFKEIQSQVKRVNVIMKNNIQPVDPKFRIKETIERRSHG